MARTSVLGTNWGNKVVSFMVSECGISCASIARDLGLTGNCISMAASGASRLGDWHEGALHEAMKRRAAFLLTATAEELPDVIDETGIPMTVWADAAGVTKQAVFQWANGTWPWPAERKALVEREMRRIGKLLLSRL